MVSIQTIKLHQQLLLVGLLFACLPHIFSQSALVIFFCTSLIAWYVLHLALKVSLPGKWLITITTVIVLTIITLTEPIFLGRNMGVAILLIALCLKLIENNKSNDMLVTVSLGYFVTVTALLFNNSLFTALSSVFAILLLTCALVLYNSPGNLPNRILANLFRLILQAIPLTLLLLVLIPQSNGPMWQLPMDARNGGLGLSDQLGLGKILKLKENDDIAFRVKFESPPIDESQLYWRGPVFTHYNGQTWVPGSQSTIDKSLPPEYNQNLAKVNTPANAARYSVTLEPHNFRWLLTLDQPTLISSGSTVSIDGEHLAENNVTHPVSYNAISSANLINSQQTIYNTQPYLLQRYLRLPNLYAHKTRQLANEFKQQAGNAINSDQKIVDLVLSYFSSESFYYTTQPPPIKYDPVEEFLFRTRSGYCEHYASAFTFMMRAAGIPARVVTGFYGGEYNSAGNYYIVRQSSAHAWSEVWLRNKGWTSVDPVTVIPDSRVELNAGEQTGIVTVNDKQFANSLDIVNYKWSQFVIAFDRAINRSLNDWKSIFSAAITNGNFAKILVTILLMLLAVSILCFVIKNRLSYRKDPAQFLFRQFCKKIEGIGIIRLPHESASDFIEKIITIRPDLTEIGDNISRLYNHLRYARNPSVKSIDEFRKTVRSLKT